MGSKKILTLCLVLASLLAPGFAMAQNGLPRLRTPCGKSTGVVVNGKTLSAQILGRFRAHGTEIPPGRYWYDAKTGAWGTQGQGTQGFLQAGLRLGGKLKANASNGQSVIFINGRRLPYSDVQALRRMGVNAPAGKYWCRANGDCGRQGSHEVLVNLRQAQQKNSVTYSKSILIDTGDC